MIVDQSLQKVFSRRLVAYYESTAPLLDVRPRLTDRTCLLSSPMVLQYFSKAYPGYLHTLAGSTSDEVSYGRDNDDAADEG